MPDDFLPISGQVSALVVEHGRHPRNFGPLPEYDGHARITGPCGDTMEFWIQVNTTRVVRVGFTTTGCESSRAAGSMATELATGAPLSAVAQIRQTDILAALGGLPPDSEHCALLAANTIQAAVEDYVHREAAQSAPTAETDQPTTAAASRRQPSVGRSGTSLSRESDTAP